MQHGNLDIAGLNQFFVSKVLIFFSCISWSDLLSVFLFHEANCFLYFDIHLGQTLAILRFQSQLFYHKSIVTKQRRHNHIFGSCSILRVVEVDPKECQVFLFRDRSILNHTQVESSIIEFIFFFVDQDWDDQRICLAIKDDFIFVCNSFEIISFFVSINGNKLKALWAQFLA